MILIPEWVLIEINDALGRIDYVLILIKNTIKITYKIGAIVKKCLELIMFSHWTFIIGIRYWM